MTKTEKRKIGDIGEDIACRYLEKEGYIVIGRNYWKPWGEIDIIAKKANSISFVEVKSVSREPEQEGRVQEIAIRPEDNLHPAKLKRLHRAVQTYLLEKNVPESTPWQIDLACVFLNFSDKKAKVELLQNIIL